MLAPLTVSSTTPSLGPWHAFFLEGTLTSSTNGTEAQYTVVVMGKFGDEWRFMNSCPVQSADDWGGPRDMVLTGTGGGFFLQVWSCVAPDSIAPAVVLPGTIIRGPQFARSGLERQAYNASAVTTEDGFLCDHKEAHEYLDGYMYQRLEHLIVVVP
jgi:hypothetical protein